MKKWDAEKFTINARLKILTRLLLNRVNRRVNAINPAALVFTCEVAYQKSLKSVHICKSYCEKQMPLFYLDTVYIAMWMLCIADQLSQVKWLLPICSQKTFGYETHLCNSLLTLLSAVVSDGYISKCSVPSRSNLQFLIFDIRALWRSVLSARVPECQKLKTVG